jgi:cell division protein ZapA|tara:strand:+ start:1001 stop:1309 length:309 start_codon:yes stop_codon:yes gene_type:complete
MTEQAKNIISIVVLGQDYKISCDPSENDQVIESAKILNGKLIEIRENSNIDEGKASIIAALNITKDLLSIKNTQISGKSSDDSLRKLSLEIENQIKSLTSFN